MENSSSINQECFNLVVTQLGDELCAPLYSATGPVDKFLHKAIEIGVLHHTRAYIVRETLFTMILLLRRVLLWPMKTRNTKKEGLSPLFCVSCLHGLTAHKVL